METVADFHEYAIVQLIHKLYRQLSVVDRHVHYSTDLSVCVLQVYHVDVLNGQPDVCWQVEVKAFPVLSTQHIVGAFYDALYKLRAFGAARHRNEAQFSLFEAELVTEVLHPVAAVESPSFLLAATACLHVGRGSVSREIQITPSGLESWDVVHGVASHPQVFLLAQSLDAVVDQFDRWFEVPNHACYLWKNLGSFYYLLTF